MNAGTSSDGVMPQSDQQLWTLQISGPASFSFQSPGNPGVGHEGGVSVAHLVLRQEEVGEIKLLAAQAGCTVKAWSMEGQTEEQTAERARFMNAGEGEPLWPSPTCPTCPWFNPLVQGSSCELDTLPEESVAELLRVSEPHVEAKGGCPVRTSGSS